MIRPIATYPTLRPLAPEPSGSLPLSSGLNAFQQILHNELGVEGPLESLYLEFLIKTIESMIRTSSGDRSALLLSELSGLGVGPSFPSSNPSPTSSDPPAKGAQGKPKGQEFDGIIQEAAALYGVDPALIKAVIAVESNGNPKALSPAGAQGLMQLMPQTAEELGVKDPFDPRENIMAGTRYLSRLLERYRGNRTLALAAYNWGMGNLEKHPQRLPRETREYVVRVEKQLHHYLIPSSQA